jgi:hypothetical protein
MNQATLTVTSRKIRITYEIVTPESAEQGDADERGWIDEDGVSMEPDETDIEDEVSAVDKAIKFLKENGATEPSSSDSHVGLWYTCREHDTDLGTGAVESRSYHLVDFMPHEEFAIYDGMKGTR